ncbi:hypothetical protein P280DRAFT_45498 [Massarina eburnea CBS 473.64]|uniref:Uncharacterized protein n=1 Tax=Massarina eburnea CBS 473.64 TaxID=1395130 RepID=A0A6A6RWH0_9PLEO|nr:hypothetical protein P280DRAFT_45498 [Massarina eburnea CBS 473.64]
MSFSQHHIPFPKNWLSVNTPITKSTRTPGTASSPTESNIPAHGFLSNVTSRPAFVPRHSSVSSVSSIDSTSSTASTSTAFEHAASPFPQQTSHSFLSLNAKYAAPPTSAQAMKEVETNGFLSNRI